MAADRGDRPLRVIMIGAHPDDCEFKAAGTAALWVASGVKVQFVAVANGDCGHQSLGGGALAKRRAAESRHSAEILGVSWCGLDIHDGEVVPSLDARKAVIRAIRRWQADLVITHRTNDYHADHRYTGQLVQDAAYMVTVPNVCADTPALKRNPVFMYFLDSFRKPLPMSVDVAVDIDRVMDKKWRSLDAMESQMYEWLPWIDNRLHEVPSSKGKRIEWLKIYLGDIFRGYTSACTGILARRYGAERASGVQYAEGFELCEYGRQPSREELWEMFPR